LLIGGGMLGGVLRAGISALASSLSLRSASTRVSDWIFCVGATRTCMPGTVVGIDGAAVGAVTTAIGVPQFPQNRESGSFWVPQVGQRIRAPQHIRVRAAYPTRVTLVAGMIGERVLERRARLGEAVGLQ
jgi:hypothetical protein